MMPPIDCDLRSWLYAADTSVSRRIRSLRVAGWNSEISSVGKIIPGTNTMALVFEEHAAPERTPGIYFLVRGESVIYVGKSTSVKNRIHQHVQNGRDFDYALWLPCANFFLTYAENLWTVRLRPAMCSERAMRSAIRHVDFVNSSECNYDIDL